MLLNFLVSIGVIFFAAKGFSQSFQSLNSSLIRRLFNMRTTKYLSSVFVGFGVAIFNQSTSGITNIVLSYVNVGLLGIEQSILTLLGAQLGLASTAWFFTIPGMVESGFLFLAVGILMVLFRRSSVLNQLFTSLFYIGLLFLGFKMMGQSGFANVELVGRYLGTGLGHESYYLDLLVVMFIVGLSTAISGSKLFVIFVLFAIFAKAEISNAVLLVTIMGIQLGASIPGLVYARAMSSRTQRTAFGYLLVEVTVMFGFLVFVIDQPALFTFDNIYLSFSIQYTLYSLISILIYLVGIRLFRWLTDLMVPEARYKEAKKLLLVGRLSDVSTSLALDLIEQELKKMSAIVEVQLDMVRSHLVGKNDDRAQEKRVNKYEKITDNMDKEISDIAHLLMERNLSKKEANELQMLFKFSDELESIADAIDDLVLCSRRVHEQDELVDLDIKKKIRLNINLLQDYYLSVFTSLTTGEPVEIEKIEQISLNIKQENDSLRVLQKQSVRTAKISAELNEILFELNGCYRRMSVHQDNFAFTLNRWLTKD
ncbi:MAG: hypothetical protein AB8E15_10280 [Bdellovibrionales bacterium]